MAVWNALFGFVGDVPALELRIRELLDAGAQWERE